MKVHLDLISNFDNNIENFYEIKAKNIINKNNLI